MDDRFSHVFKDPRFQRVPVKERKLKIDKRFKGMFNDKRFCLKYTVDKRGRPVNTSTSENLQKYYQLSEDDDSEDDSDDDDDNKEENEAGTSKLTEKVKLKKKEKRKELKKDKERDKEKKKLIDGDSSDDNNNDDGVILKSKKKEKKMAADDSLVEDKKAKISETTATDTTKLQKKRKLLLTDSISQDKTDAPKRSRKDISAQVDSEDEESIERLEEEEEEEEDGVSEEEESTDSESGLGSGPDPARGIGNESSSSDDSDSDSDDEVIPSTAEDIIHDWGEFDKSVQLTSELSRRLAVCNMDWDNITATDLFVVLNSFKPPDGTVLSVKIYPSEFGKQRIEEENAKGPAELTQIALDVYSSDDNNEENEEGKSFHNEKLRQYQLNRMKYYYAVIECDTLETANHIYTELDGAEYESSKTCFDLRFIPDDMEFDEDVKDSCTELPSKDLYKPNQFLNVALSEAEVALTWDETDKKRLEATTKIYNKKSDIKLEDFQDYLALSSEGEEEEKEEKHASDASLISNSDSEFDDDDNASGEDGGGKSSINKYKKLLEGIEETERKKEEKQLEVTWDIGLKEKTEKVLKIKEKKKSSSPWNEFLDKLKEKQRKRKEKIKALKKSTEKKDSAQTFSDDEVPSDIDLNDPYFSSELASTSNKKSKTQKKKEKKEKQLKKLLGEVEDYSGLTPDEVKQKKKELAELELLMADEDDVKKKNHFDYEKIIKEESKSKSKKKAKIQKEKQADDFKLDLNDDRFSAIYSSSAFNIDKSAPEYKKSSAMEALIEEKMRRRYTAIEDPDGEKPKKGAAKSSIEKNLPSRDSASVDDSVNNLIRSVKMKTNNFNFPKTKPNLKNSVLKKMKKL